MKLLVLTILSIVAVSASLLEESGKLFQEFKVKHGKTYKNQVEETQRFTIFKDNLRSIEEHNVLYEKGLVTYKKAPNRFADMTHEEFKAFLTLHTKPSTNGTRYVKRGVAVPESIDYRNMGQVTEVKNQGNCGSCWSFSLTGAIEGAYVRKTGNLVSLSEQQLVDCATEVNSGCDGGYMEQTYPYIQANGIESEDSYPYQAVDGRCSYDSSKVVTGVDDYVVLEQNESQLLEAVGTVGPVSVAVDADYLDFYSSGVFSDNRCTITAQNHGVLVVGYGSEGGQDFWIVKNSWSSDWGENGYYKLLRGNNECGVAMDASYPIIY